MSLIRENLMKYRDYSPYCGNHETCSMPRTKFDGEQFVCPHCKWRSQFPPEFIAEYKAKWSSQKAEVPDNWLKIYKDEMMRGDLISLPRKLEFAAGHNMKNLDEVHTWMAKVRLRFVNMVLEAQEQNELQQKKNM